MSGQSPGWLTPAARLVKGQYVPGHFGLVEDWLGPDQRPIADPLAELTRRYLAGHGPAGVDDLAAWAGLPV